MLSKEETLEKINISLPSYAAEKISYASDSKFQEKEEILKKIMRMRKIASNNYYDPTLRNFDYFEIRNYTFYEQAKLMEDVVDDYDKVITPEYSYFWNYEALEIPELRTYFTWRTKVRNKEYPKIPVGYILIYISELINLIGVSSSIEAFDKIVEIIHVYYDQINEVYFKEILKKIPKSFIINYQLPLEKLDDFKIENTDKKKEEQMLRIYQKDYTDILDYLEGISSYKILNSNFYSSKYGFLIESVIPNVFLELEKYFKEEKIDFSSYVLGKKERISPYTLFKSLSYYEKRNNFSGHTIISEIEEYYFYDGICTAYIYTPSPNSRILLGIILKQIEARLREKTKYKRKITVNLSQVERIPVKRKIIADLVEDEKFIKTINHAVDQVLIEKQQEIKKKYLDKRKNEIIVDPTTFDEIRKSTERVKEKLITEEEKEEEILEEKEEQVEIKIEEIPEQEPVVEMGNDSLLKNLTDLEMTILRKIIDHAPRIELENIAKKNMALLEVIIENINLKSLDYIGDNLIEDLISEVGIYEDYIDEIKTELEKMEV